VKLFLREPLKTRANALKQFAFLTLNDSSAFFPKSSISFTKPTFCEFIGLWQNRNRQPKKSFKTTVQKLPEIFVSQGMPAPDALSVDSSLTPACLSDIYSKI
jgi:hypothetical protein